MASEDDAAIAKLHVGDTVRISGIDKPGHIAFLGAIAGKAGKWVGVVLETPDGKNDGSAGGVRYFDAKPNHGVFAKPKAVTVVESVEGGKKPAPPPAAAAAGAKKAPPPPAGGKPDAPAAKPAIKEPVSTPARPSATAATKPTPSPEPKKEEIKTPVKPAEQPKKEEPPKTPALSAPTAAKDTTGKKEEAPKTPATTSATKAATTTKDKDGGKDGGGMRGKITDLEKQLATANGIIGEMQKQLADTQAGGSGGAVYDLSAAQEKKLLAEIETLTAANDGLRTELKKHKDKAAELETFRPFKQKCHDLETEVQKMKKQKQQDDETIETLQLEWDTCKEELALAQDDLKIAQDQTSADLQKMIEALPSGQAETARMSETNRQLTEMLKKTRDSLQATLSKYETLKLETDSELEELRAKVVTVDKLEEDYANLKEAFEEMRSLADGNSNLEVMVEKLSEKNTDLLAQHTEARAQIRALKELVAANEAVDEGHLELENQLQTELESKTMELQEAHRQLKIKQSQLEDLNNVNKSFKNLVKDLENMNQDLAAAQAMNQEEKANFRKGRQNSVKMLTQMSEIRHRTIEQLYSKLEAREYSQSYSFLRAYIPDNVSVEEGGLQLQVKADRLFLMATQGARILHELFGAGSGKGDRVATRVYEICDKLVSYAHSCNKLRFCIRVADPKQYDSMVAERDTLDNARQEVQALLDLAARDEILYDTPLDGLNVAHENVQGFIGSNFPDDQDDSSELATIIRRGPPKINLEVQRLLFMQGAAVAKLEVIADLLSSHNSAEGEEPALFQRIFEQMEALQQSNKELTNKILTQSVSFEIVVSNSKSHDPNMFKEDLDLCFRFSRGGVLRLKEMLEWADQLLAKTSGSLAGEESAADAEKRRKSTIAQLDARFEMEMKEGRLLAELQSIRSCLESLAKRLDTANTAAGEAYARPVWETRALEVRQELMQAASLRMSLEEATKRTEAKTRELFAAKKLARDSQSLVDVLQAKIAMLQTKTNEADDMATEVERLRKKEKEFETASEGLQKEREKYTTANTALRSKNLKLKYELKRLQEGRAAAPTPGVATGLAAVSGKNLTSLQGASDELSLLTRTIAVQRQQIAALRAAQAQKDLAASLPALPCTKPLVIHDKGQHTAVENVAVQNQLQALPSPFVNNRADLETVYAFKQDFSKLSSRAQHLRSAPVLVDLSAKESVNQQWHASKTANEKLKADAAALEGKFGDFLASKQSALFRSLCANVPATGASVPGSSPPVVSVGPNDKLVGKVTVPLGLQKDLQTKVLLRPSQLQQLHSIFVS